MPGRPGAGRHKTGTAAWKRATLVYHCWYSRRTSKTFTSFGSRSNRADPAIGRNPVETADDSLPPWASNFRPYRSTPRAVMNREYQPKKISSTVMTPLVIAICWPMTAPPLVRT